VFSARPTCHAQVARPVASADAECVPGLREMLNVARAELRSRSASCAGLVETNGAAFAIMLDESACFPARARCFPQRWSEKNNLLCPFYPIPARVLASANG
jgi:hypothetical protein